ncbi:MAG: potassium uptake protein [Deinococcales bacterium]
MSHKPMSHKPMSHKPKNPQGRYLLTLSLAALGVVFGDIGTSPLYAFREALAPDNGLIVMPESIFGILSLIFWSLAIVISLKYLFFLLRADNQGEGGILALTALVAPIHSPAKAAAESKTMKKLWVYFLFLGLFGTALLYGDGIITPAISVLSAVEGLEFAAPSLHPFVLPITIIILVLLFAFQRRGTAKVGAVFGPITLIWFMVLAVLGLVQIFVSPQVLLAINPYYAFKFFRDFGFDAFLVLGSVFLVVTGGEALYADMGHFGKKPIRLMWFSLVLPALLLNYFGQGALLLRIPEAVDNPFYKMVPSWALIPVLLLATAATIIASQALISGAFSLTLQAVQLGYAPRLNIGHTSDKAFGQVYIPGVNWLLMIGCILLVLGFRSSSSLAAAYGIAVTMTMFITTLLFFVLTRSRWHWPLTLSLGLCGFFLLVDVAFLGANIFKIHEGGWFPLLVALAVFTILTTWKRGRELVSLRLREGALPIDVFIKNLKHDPPIRVPGSAVFMFRDPLATPPALLTNLRYNHVLHEKVIILVADTLDVPRVAEAKREVVKDLGQGFLVWSCAMVLWSASIFLKLWGRLSTKTWTFALNRPLIFWAGKRSSPPIGRGWPCGESSFLS